MKTLQIAIFVLALSSGVLADTPSASHVAALAAKLSEVEGCAVGEGGTPGRFYLLAQYTIGWCEPADIDSLLRHDHPMARLLGYQCALARQHTVDDKIERALLADTTQVVFFPYGCVGERATIGEIARQIKGDVSLLLASPKE